MTLRKWTALLLALVLCLGAQALAQAETEYPPRPSGAAADLAGVLGEKTIQDLDTLSEQLSDATGGHFFVLTRHFLGGADVQQYADKVFEVWGLTPNDALLLMVIGEESFALSLGAAAKGALSTESRTTMLGAFKNSYEARQYDEALANLALTAAQALAKASGSSLNTSGLLGQEAIQSTPQPQTWDESWYGMFAQDDYDSRENDYSIIWENWQDEWHHEESQINWRSLIIWALVIYFLFFRRKKNRKGRR